jgi:putative alpha-1,2-mannosidase
MGALNALMAMGLFSVNGGGSLEPFYELTSPVFERIVVHLDPEYYQGERFTIEVERTSPEDVYIQSARLNGEALRRPWFYHRELVQGGTLELVLGPEPNRAWGSRVEDAPPSMSKVGGL